MGRINKQKSRLIQEANVRLDEQMPFMGPSGMSPIKGAPPTRFSTAVTQDDLMKKIDKWCKDKGFTEEGDMASRDMPVYSDDIEDLMITVEGYCGSSRA